MSDDVAMLGLGPRLADPASIWPTTTVIVLMPEVAGLLGDRPEAAVRAALAQQAGVDAARFEDVAVTGLADGGANVRLGSESDAARALDVAARRRGTNAAEALHAAVLGLDGHHAA